MPPHLALRASVERCCRRAFTAKPYELTASPFYRIREAREAVVDRWSEGGLPVMEVDAWRCERDRLADNASGWATNVSLGFMLGMTPALGHFLGLPLDVRHVTPNSGMLSLASTSLGRRWFGEGVFLLSVAGVGVMFVLNLSVSFLRALASAARAYELRAQDNAELLRGLFRRFTRTPLDFFVPPRAARPNEEPTVAMP